MGNCFCKPKPFRAANKLIYLNIGISKIHGARHPPRHRFFTYNSHLWSNYLMIFISWSRERSKGKLVLQNYFLLTMFIVDVWPCRYLNKPWILNMSEFWIYRGSKYTRVLNMFLILNMLGFWMYHGSKYDRITQGFEYAWIIPRYAWLCLNVPKFVWVAFVLLLPIIIPHLKEP